MVYIISISKNIVVNFIYSEIRLIHTFCFYFSVRGVGGGGGGVAVV